MIRKIFYYTLKYYTSIAQRVYFRRFKIHESYPIPKDASIIFAANHQNAFLDAVALIDSQPLRVTWLTRASMFKTSIARFWLHAMHMLPIYRTRDGLREVNKNQEIIEECIRLLNERSQTIGIFPEGNHGLKMRLRPLQKGVARIAFDAADQAKDPNSLFIVPCGFSYSDHTKFRSDLLVNFGKPICVGDFYTDWKNDPVLTTQSFLVQVKANLSEVMIDIKSAEKYQEHFKIWKENKKHHPNLYKEFLADKKLIEKIESGTFQAEESKKKSNLILKIIEFPVYLIGLINNLPLVGVMSLIHHKVVTDIHFVTPIRFAAGLFVVPLIYSIQGTVFYYFSGLAWWWTFIYLIASFFTGLLAADYHNAFISSGSDEK